MGEALLPECLEHRRKSRAERGQTKGENEEDKGRRTVVRGDGVYNCMSWH